ncbi:PREDICTED: cyclin-dependent kinase inhibitor 2A, isoform 4 [Elephantulus edwardii]|uniref:cyclin-dependent kinase inhibitor 2A, isoform 4 n=1 Tax=Elephantulus edwardii TaxID=28737 RepID=UPI0003F069B0|nr:PREDICTED: cyclin-dependent kinase inhibitor 2A, isoform 4 [Elephantulus edwardii]
MVRRFLVTVRIRRGGGPPRVRSFVVHIVGSPWEWGEARQRALDLVLCLLRSVWRRQPPHPRRPGFRPQLNKYLPPGSPPSSLFSGSCLFPRRIQIPRRNAGGWGLLQV